jgi:hypothetical protein
MIALSEKQWKWLIIGGLIAALITIGLLWWAYSGDGVSEHERKDAVNIGIDIGKNAVQANLMVNQEKEVNNAANQSNQAGNALNRSVDRDSSTFNGNSSGDRFCRDFPDDSTCQH